MSKQQFNLDEIAGVKSQLGTLHTFVAKQFKLGFGVTTITLKPTSVTVQYNASYLPRKIQWRKEK